MNNQAVKTQKKPFWERIDEIFLFPFQGNGFYTYTALAVFIWFISYLPFLGTLIATGIFLSYIANIIKHAGFGQTRIPNVEMFLDLWDSVFMPIFRFMVALSTIIVPVTLYLIIKFESGYDTSSFMHFMTDIFDPFIFFFLILGFCYFPCAFCVAAINENIFHVLNPLVGINLIRKSMGSYIVLLLFLAGFIFGSSLLNILVEATIGKLSMPFIPKLIRTWINLYFPTLEAFAIGLWVYQNNDKFDYYLETDDSRILPYSGQADYGVASRAIGETIQRNLNDPLADELSFVREHIKNQNFPKANEILIDLNQRFPEDERPTEILFDMANDNQNQPELALYGAKLFQQYLDQDRTQDIAKLYRSMIESYNYQIELPAEILFRIGKAFSAIKATDLAIKAYMHMAILYPGFPKTINAMLIVSALYSDKLRQPKKALELLNFLSDIFGTTEFAPQIDNEIKRLERLVN